MPPLPACEGRFAVLPYRDDPYLATLDEIEHHFVDKAPEPTRGRRALIMRALRLHIDVVHRFAKNRGATIRVLVDGGFITWKPQTPRDVDLVVLAAPAAYPEFVKPAFAPFWTLSVGDATLGGSGEVIDVGELRPGFGLTDAYVNPDLSSNRRKWHGTWSRVRNPETNEIVDTERKGYIEVVMSDD